VLVWLHRTIAIWRVRWGHAERICAPGQWVVWREGDVVLSKDLPA
jgi:hypothetical protein